MAARRRSPRAAARHSGSGARGAVRAGLLGAGLLRTSLLGIGLVLAGAGMGGVAAVLVGVFSAQTASGSTLSLASLDSWLPSSVTTSRLTAATCQVSWVPHGSAPVGATYDVTDGTSTLASDQAGVTTVVTVGAGAATPVVKLRVGTWVSPSGTAAASACTGWPSAPVLTLTPTENQIAATWTAPSGNGAAVASYDAGISPAGTGTSSCSGVPAAASRSCVFTGLTDGVTYTVSVTATSSEGTGPGGTATAVPYPSSVMTGSATKLWLDGADSSTLFASSSCSGATATSTVGCWQDKSGQADHATQTTGGKQPSLSTLNGLTAPSFNGSSSVMALDVSKLPTGGSDSSVFMVATMEDPTPTTSSHRGALGWGADASGRSRAVTKPWHSSLAYQDTWGLTPPAGSSWSSTGTVFSGRLSGGTSSTVNVDGAGSYTETVALNTGTAAGAWLGNHVWGNWAYWQGRIAEVVVLNQSVSASQNRQVEEYLARKWGVVITPQAPTGLTGAPTAAAGTDAVMSWTAPVWNGGSVVTGYTVTATPTGGGSPVTCTSIAPSTTCTLTGLAGGAAGYSVTVAAANAVGAGPASTATTLYAGLPVAANLKLWLDGADPASMYFSSTCTGATASTIVGCWKDKSAQTNHAIQATTVRKPALAAVNGRSVLSFDGSNSYLAMTPSLLPVGTTTGTEFTVATLTDPTPASSGLRDVLNYGTLSGGQARQIQKLASSSTRVVSVGTDITQGTWTSTPGIVGAEFTSSSETIWSDGQAGATATGLTNNTGTSYARLGATNVPSQYWYGQIPEVIVYTGTLTATQRRSIEDYLATKWGVTITPGPPLTPSAVAGNATATVTWTSPTSNGGAAVTSYTVTPVGGPGSCTWTAGTSASCSGLTNGTAYTFTVAAVNSVGTGSIATTGSVTPTGPPGAPTAVAATAADTTSSVSWTAPSNGGSAITSYTATAVPSDGTLPTQTCSSASSPCTVSGLTNGITYTVTVTATNALGTGTASGSATVVPYPAAVMTGASFKLWLDGADTSTYYSDSGCTTATSTAGASLGCWKDKSGTLDHATSATNAPALATLGSRVVPSFTATSSHRLDLDIAKLPTGSTASTTLAVVLSADANPASVTHRTVVSWGYPLTDNVRVLNKPASSAAMQADEYSGSSPSQGTLVQNTPFLASASFATSGLSLWTNGLGTPATGTAPSMNTRSTATAFGCLGCLANFNTDRWNGKIVEVLIFSGTLTTSQRTNLETYLARKWAVTIAPPAPQSPSATAGNTTATVSWTAPAWNGGGSVTSYSVTPVGGAGSCTWSAGTTASCTGLTNGTAYTFTVAAVNSVGTGPTATTGSVTPTGPPGAPTAVAATAADTTSSVSWTAPASNGGSAITSYTATAVPSDGTLPTQTCSSASSPCTVSGLTNGITYTVTVTATNAVGTGAASASAPALPYPTTVMSGNGFKMWLAADDLDGDGVVEGASESGLVSSAVQTWVDKSGKGHTVTAASAGERPPYGSQTLNSLRVPTFNGSMSLQEAGLNPYAVSSSRTLVAVVRARSVDTADTVGDAGTGTYVNDRSSNTSGVFSVKVCSSQWAIQSRNDAAGTGGGAICTASGIAPSAGRVDILAATRSGTTDALWVSGEGGGSGNQSGTVTQNGFTIGRTNAATQDLDIAEFMLFNTALSSTDRRTVDEYLVRKWGGAIAPQAPTGMTATAGSGTASATVSWTAPPWDGGTAVTDYVVQYKLSGAGSWTTFADGTSTVTTATITGLTPGADYDVQVLAVNATGTGAASATGTVTIDPLWSPAVLGSAVAFWVDADDANTLTNSSGAVSAWADKSGNSRTASQATAANKPTLVGSAMGGRSAVTFDGSNDYLPFTGSFIANTDYTVAVAASRTSSKNTNWYLAGSSNSTNANLHAGWGSSTTISHRQSFNDCDTTIPAYTSETAEVHVYRHSGSTGQQTWRNGTAGCSSATTTDLSGWTGSAVGCYGSTNCFAGRVGELVIATSALSTSDRQKLEAYLAWKWGTQSSLAAGHPYATSAPTASLSAPSAPLYASAVPGSSTATVSWSPPAWNGGAAVTSYAVTPSGAGSCTWSSGTTASCTGLTHLASYTFTVRATNSAGAGSTVTTAAVTP